MADERAVAAPAVPEINKWIIAITVMLPTLIEIIDTSVVNVSLDHIRGSLSATIDESTWTITSYLVSNAIIIPMTGWLSRVFGRKKYLISSIALFTVASLFCGLAWNLQSLVFFRVLQGIGGGALQPISQAILLESFPRKQHGMAMAIFGIGIMFGPIIGPLLGGWVTDNWSWHWIFFINVPIGVLSILMVMFFIYNPPYMKKMKMKIDYWGLTFLALGLGCLQVILDRGQQDDWFSSHFIVWLAAISFISLVLFLMVEFFAEHPIMNLRTFKNISFTTGCIVMFFAFFNLFGSIVLLPIYLQTLMGYTAYLAGVVLGPGGMATLIAMPVAGRLVTKVNPKGLLASGIIVGAYSTYLMSEFNLYASLWTVIWPRIVLGVGMGLLFIPLTTMTMSTISKENMGNATAIYNLLRNLGGSFGVAFVTTMAARRAQFHQSQLISNLTPFDRTYQNALHNAGQFFHQQGFPAAVAPQAGAGAIYGQLQRQVHMMSFNDAFHLLSLFMIIIVPLVLLMRQGKGEAPAGMH